jgi:HD-like signal output (HDOD) protein
VRERLADLRREHAAPGRPGADDVARWLDGLAEGPGDSVRQLPGAAQEALALCSDPYASFAELARLCGGDPTLAQALLRYANSAYYARAGHAPAESIRDAATRVGASGVQNVLLSVTVHGLLCRPGGDMARLAEQVWEHMVRTAAVARALAPAFGAAADRAYALGLLHDVGKLVVLDQAAALRVRLRRTPQLPAPAVHDALRSLHEPLGALALLRWGLGADAARSVGAHHRAPPPEQPDPTGELLHVAERADLAALHGVALDLAEVWARGALLGSAARAGRALDQHFNAAAPA